MRLAKSDPATFFRHFDSSDMFGLKIASISSSVLLPILLHYSVGWKLFPAPSVRSFVRSLTSC